MRRWALEEIGEEFGEALYQAEDDRLKNAHRHRFRSWSCSRLVRLLLVIQQEIREDLPAKD